MPNNKVEYRIVVRSQFSNKVFAQNVVIRIPTPLNTSNTKIHSNQGRTKYVGSENHMVWKYVI